MTIYVPRTWHNDPTVGPAPLGVDTPLDAVGIGDLEQRVTNFTNTRVPQAGNAGLVAVSTAAGDTAWLPATSLAPSIVLQGTLAARPAAAPSNAGVLYYSTTDQSIARSDGSTWTNVSPAELGYSQLGTSGTGSQTIGTSSTAITGLSQTFTAGVRPIMIDCYIGALNTNLAGIVIGFIMLGATQVSKQWLYVPATSGHISSPAGVWPGSATANVTMDGAGTLSGPLRMTTRLATSGLSPNQTVVAGTQYTVTINVQTTNGTVGVNYGQDNPITLRVFEV